MKLLLVTVCLLTIASAYAELPPELSSHLNRGDDETISSTGFEGLDFRLGNSRAYRQPGPFAPSDDISDGLTLPRVVITASRLTLTEDNVLTDQGRIELAEKRYISPLYRLTFGPLSQLATYYYNPLSIFEGWHPNEREAMTLYDQDQRLRRISEVDYLIRLQSAGGAGDTKDLKQIRRELQKVRYNFILSR